MFEMRCHASEAGNQNALILNRSMCFYPGFIRFLVAGDESGQFALEIGFWHDPDGRY